MRTTPKDFLAEGQKLCDLDHAFVLRCYGFVIDPASRALCGILMELMPNGSLHDWLAYYRQRSSLCIGLCTCCWASLNPYQDVVLDRFVTYPATFNRDPCVSVTNLCARGLSCYRSAEAVSFVCISMCIRCGWGLYQQQQLREL